MSAKSKDTTKTAHVMNLLRKNTSMPVENRQTGDVQSAEDESVQIKISSVKHPIIASLNEEAAVSLEIRDALEQELEKTEQRTQAQSVSPLPGGDVNRTVEEPISTEEKQDQKITAIEESELEVSDVIMENSPSANCNEEAAVKKTEQAAAVVEAEKEIFNVMQVMVDESAQKYMTMFGLCDCPRCRADVRAIALNNLQPKYVVMEEGEYIPRITLYEQQFKVPVTAQILRACNIVAEKPRHNQT